MTNEEAGAPLSAWRAAFIRHSSFAIRHFHAVIALVILLALATPVFPARNVTAAAPSCTCCNKCSCCVSKGAPSDTSAPAAPLPVRAGVEKLFQASLLTAVLMTAEQPVFRASEDGRFIFLPPGVPLFRRHCALLI